MSAGSKGLQVYLPGAHSDIGGSDWGDINGGNLAQFLDEMNFDWKHPIDSISNIKKAGEKMLKEAMSNKKGNVPSLNAFFWLQHINLRDPWKGTKNGNPKEIRFN